MSVLKTYGSDRISFKPSKTYRIQGDRIGGFVDGLEAVGQAAALMLSTERYQYPIYSHDYGVEFEDLIGKHRNYIAADVERRITEALLQDDRINHVDDFHISFGRESMSVRFTVYSDFGELEMERGIPID